jgi:hypothetical protein
MTPKPASTTSPTMPRFLSVRREKVGDGADGSTGLKSVPHSRHAESGSSVSLPQYPQVFMMWRDYGERVSSGTAADESA